MFNGEKEVENEEIDFLMRNLITKPGKISFNWSVLGECDCSYGLSREEEGVISISGGGGSIIGGEGAISTIC
jgi:hypothetical protein